MKHMLALCLAISFITAVAEASRHPSSAPRSFKAFLEAKIRRIYDEVVDLKQEVEDCCNKADCGYMNWVWKDYEARKECTGIHEPRLKKTNSVASEQVRHNLVCTVTDDACQYGGDSHDDGSVFTAEDDCNICVCKHGSVDCTNSTACGQTAGSSYNYRDEIAQAYCATKAITTGVDPKHVSAVRRDCDDPGAANTCSALCGNGSTFASSVTASFPSAGLEEFNCAGGLWFWNDHPVLPPNPGPNQTGAGLLNLVTISYDNVTGCAATDCGPNYCCCFAVDGI